MVFRCDNSTYTAHGPVQQRGIERTGLSFCFWAAGVKIKIRTLRSTYKQQYRVVEG